MKNISHLSLIAFILFVASCKKNDDNNNNNTNSNQTNPLSSQLGIGGGPNIPSGAAGALYAINVNDSVGGSNNTIGYAMAWFGSYTTTKNAGSVTCLGDSLSTSLGFLGVNYPWYINFIAGSGAPITFSGTPVPWIVQGNSGSGVPAFSYSDNTQWPVVNGYGLVANVNIASPLTVNYTISGPATAVFITISASLGSKTYTASSTTATAYTFTSAQLSAVAAPGIGDMLSVEIMPVTLTPHTVSGQTYYFVKQNAFTQSANVQ